VITGHGGVATRADADRWQSYLHALEDTVRACKAGGNSEDACAASVTLREYDYKPIPFTSTREKNVRAMYKALSPLP
jgi:hypothetical protein